MKIDDDIHNYYENMVTDKIEELGLGKTKDSNYLADLVCLSLNQLPTRYIRHEVDMAFYLPASERLQMSMNVENAVKRASEYLDKNESKRDTKK